MILILIILEAGSLVSLPPCSPSLFIHGSSFTSKVATSDSYFAVDLRA